MINIDLFMNVNKDLEKVTPPSQVEKDQKKLQSIYFLLVAPSLF